MKVKKVKVLIVYNKIWAYRKKIFELLNDKYDLTVGFTDEKFISQEYSFKTVYLPTKQIGPFSIHIGGLRSIAKKYDVVIGLSDIRWLSLMFLGLLPHRKYKLIYWGIGVRASYDNLFDAKNYWDHIRFFLVKKADAVIFYSNYPIQKYVDAGFKMEQLFVAHNTVQAFYHEDWEIERNTLLFIGTLYKQKGIELLLDAYQELVGEGYELPILNIVGGGSHLDLVRNHVVEQNLSKHIRILGPIYEKDELEKLFRSAIICISPNQAGLSILSSMAYGVTFITKRDAITGGEIFNIIDKKTGLFYDGSLSDLKKKILLVLKEKKMLLEIGNNARKHYLDNRTPEIMVQGIVDAIEFSLTKR